jgi:superfamily II DNA/RNA helicase
MNKLEVVARILQSEGRGLTMIFCRTKRAADRAAEDLDFRGFAVAAVHGDLGQSARERALRAFRNGKIDVLVATDVAARGLDVSGVTHVINYDCPEDPDTYTHRIGRTGRAGATGLAVTFVDWEDMPRWRIIDKTLGLDMAEPPETYHTSAHLFADLGIDPAVSGTLPTAGRTRAGSGRRSRRTSALVAVAWRPGVGRRREVGPNAPREDDRPATARVRRRTRHAEPTGAFDPVSTPDSEVPGVKPAGRRRRSPSENGAATVEAAVAGAPAETEAPEGGSARRRRRRRPGRAASAEQ